MDEHIKIVAEPEDQPLVRLAQKYEKEADDRFEQNAGTLLMEPFLPLDSLENPKERKELVTPLRFFNNAFEVEVIRQRDHLAQRYQEALQLPSVPVLLPAEPQSPVGQAATAPAFGRRQMPFHSASSCISQIDQEELILNTLFLKRHREDLYVFTGNHYRYMSDNEIKGLMFDCLREHLRESNASSQLNNLLALLKMETRISGEPDAAPNRIAVQNGVLDLEQLRLYPPVPQDFITHYLDVEWRGFQDCPRFRGFLDFVSGKNYLLRQRILEVIGYLLVPGNQAKRFALFQGPGNTGKSVLGDLIESFCESDAVAAVSAHQFGERFSASFLAHRQINISMDLPGGVLDQKAVAVLKQITGGDLISVEGKNKEAYAGKIRCKMLFASNHPVILKDRDEAFAKRVLLVPFRVPVPEEQMDRHLLEKLEQEKSGILHWALTAYREVVHRNYQFTGEEYFGFKPQQIVIQEAPQLKLESFVTACCVLGEGSFTSTENLHQAYLRFCAQEKQETIEDRAAFSRALKLSLGEKIQSHKQRVNGVPLNGYLGIHLKEDYTHE